MVQHCKEMQRRQVVSVTLATVLNAISLTQFKVASLVAQLAKSQLVKSSFCYNVGDLGSIPGLRTPGEGKGYPLQYSGLENSKDCIDHGGRKESDTTEQLSLSSHEMVVNIISIFS